MADRDPEPRDDDAIRRAIGELATALAADPLGAEADVACFLVYAEQAGIDCGDAAGTLLERALETAPSMPGLWGGRAGLAFTIAHLADGDEAETVCDALLGELVALLDTAAWKGHYDLIGGLVGFAVAALERGDGPVATGVVDRVLAHLEASAREVDGGVAWHTAPALLPDWQRALAPEGYLNLGLAHGVPGVVALLARFLEEGVEPRRSRALLEPAVAWLRSVALDGRPGLERYPGWLPMTDRAPARAAWCYGDLGVSVALARAGNALGDGAVTADGIELARSVAALPVDRAGVRDMSLCHGSSGIAHLFRRLALATGDAVLEESARQWLARTLAMRRPGVAVAGFPGLVPRDDRELEWRTAASMLDGATGVGLAFLAATSEAEPLWDRRLLVDLPAPRAAPDR